MLVDSHCHLNMIDLAEFDGSLDNLIKAAKNNNVMEFLCVSVEFNDHQRLSQIAQTYPEVYFSIGVHPTGEHKPEFNENVLTSTALAYPKCIAIGETGLDYYRNKEEETISTQQNSFRNHIRTAKAVKKPLIIHTRNAREDTIRIMQEENADKIGGVMHCFTESWEMAQQAMDLNFYISFSGIVTFKNAKSLQEIAQKIPLDKMLIETDSPFLAPTPFRGKQNHPALVKHVAEFIASLRKESYETIAHQTTLNFRQCFHLLLKENI